MKQGMKFGIAGALVALFLPLQAGAQQWEESPDWAKIFSDTGVTGTVAVADERHGRHLVHDAERAQTRFIPASTFKIPHTLFALDAGVVADEFETFEWDGVERQFAAWNRDQDLRSAMRASAVWVYQELARRLGEEREQAYLRKIDYGNADPSGGLERFWLDGGLAISARDQVAFLQALYRNTLPFAEKHQRLVKDLIIVEAGADWILRAKSGWAFEAEIGWYVGWAETPDGPVFFALNIDMPNGMEDAPKRVAIARAVLESIDALPAR